MVDMDLLSSFSCSKSTGDIPLTIISHLKINVHCSFKYKYYNVVQFSMIMNISYTS